MSCVYQLFAQDVKVHLQKRPGPTYKVLDIASASGEPAFTLAGLLPEVEVTVTDIAEVC